MSTLPNKIISPGELAVGQYITVYEWLPSEVIDHAFGRLFGGATTRMYTDTAYCGDVLKVEAIDLPYIVISRPNESASYSGNTKLDTRQVKLMELSEEYVKAMERKPHQ